MGGVVVQVIWEILTRLFIRFVRSLQFIESDVIEVLVKVAGTQEHIWVHLGVSEISPPVVTVADELRRGDNRRQKASILRGNPFRRQIRILAFLPSDLDFSENKPIPGWMAYGPWEIIGMRGHCWCRCQFVVPKCIGYGSVWGSTAPGMPRGMMMTYRMNCPYMEIPKSIFLRAKTGWRLYIS